LAARRGKRIQIAPLEGVEIMSVSVSACQLRILVAAIVVVTVGRLLAVSIGDGLAASPASIAEPSAAAPAPGQSAQPPARLRSSRTALVQRRDPDDVLANMAVLAETYDETRMSPTWPGSPPAPGSIATAGLVMLLGTCSCVAISIYGLVAFMARRRPTELR
jgi:hypothetical protein